jgi:hypothetical protein
MRCRYKDNRFFKHIACSGKQFMSQFHRDAPKSYICEAHLKELRQASPYSGIDWKEIKEES